MKEPAAGYGVTPIEQVRSVDGLTFIKEAEGALLPTTSPLPEAAREAAAAISDGRQLSYPAPTTAVAENTLPTRPTPAPMNRGKRS